MLSLPAGSRLNFGCSIFESALLLVRKSYGNSSFCRMLQVEDSQQRLLVVIQPDRKCLMGAHLPSSVSTRHRNIMLKPFPRRSVSCPGKALTKVAVVCPRCGSDGPDRICICTLVSREGASYRSVPRCLSCSKCIVASSVHALTVSWGLDARRGKDLRGRVSLQLLYLDLGTQRSVQCVCEMAGRAAQDGFVSQGSYRLRYYRRPRTREE